MGLTEVAGMTPLAVFEAWESSLPVVAEGVELVETAWLDEITYTQPTRSDDEAADEGSGDESDDEPTEEPAD
jgi:hypothetical protein